jgi:radical SAM protein with 4Fe4S-binding SPASM domain
MERETRRYVPERCVFEATLACNLRCRHCGSSAGEPRPDELTADEAADLFAQLADLGCRRVVIAGGEPLVRHDWAQLVRSAARTGMRTGLISNGVLFDRDAALRALDAGLLNVGFSLDGPPQVHDRVRGRIGHFLQVEAAMEAAARAGLPFAIVTHVNRLNLGEFSFLHDFVADRGAYAWQVQLGTDMGSMRDNADLMIRPRDVPRIEADLARLIKLGRLRVHPSDSVGYFGPHERTLRRYNRGTRFAGCRAGISNVGIESNGNVKGCLSIEAGYNPGGAAFVEGNIRDERLADIWFAYTRDRREGRLGGFCASCAHATKCRGGCMAKRVASGRGVENPFCSHRVLEEDQLRTRRAGQAAAVALVSLLGASAQGCYSAEKPDDDTELDATADGGDAGTDADADSDSDVSTETGAYSIPDTDTVADYSAPDTETLTGDEYSIPDTSSGIDDYSVPDTQA